MPDSVSGRSPFRYPLRRVAGWQLIATGIIAAGGSLGWGWHGAISGLLGGITNLTAGAVYAMVVGLANPASAAGTVVTAFRAEAIKILLIVVQLWLVLTMYADVVHAVFFCRVCRHGAGDSGGDSDPRLTDFAVLQIASCNQQRATGRLQIRSC